MAAKKSFLATFFKIFFIFLYVENIGQCGAIEIFEFGADDNSPVVAITRGGIGAFDKYIVVPLAVSPCIDVTYVNVGIHNAIAKPQVNYDSNVNIVTISYHWYQVSTSSYSIYAKGYKNPECVLVDDEGPDGI